MGLSVLLITHDLGVIAQTCTRVYVMYAGQIVESGDTETLFRAPRHPYTQGLLASLLDPRERRNELFSIPGTVPAATAMPAGCRFHPRCKLALPDPCVTAAASPPPQWDGCGSLLALRRAGRRRCLGRAWRLNP